MASLRNDPLGKGMAQILLSMPVRVAPGLLDADPCTLACGAQPRPALPDDPCA